VRILGIDVGSTLVNPTGWAVIETEQDVVLTYGLIKPRGEDHFGCLVRAFNCLLDDMEAYRLDHVAIEVAHIGPNRQTGLLLARYVGAYEALCAVRHIPYREIQPSQAKAALAGRGDAGKGEMQSAARLRYDLALPSHVADAIAVALASIEWGEK